MLWCILSRYSNVIDIYWKKIPLYIQENQWGKSVSYYVSIPFWTFFDLCALWNHDTQCTFQYVKWHNEISFPRPLNENAFLGLYFKSVWWVQHNQCHGSCCHAIENQSTIPFIHHIRKNLFYEHTYKRPLVGIYILWSKGTGQRHKLINVTIILVNDDVDLLTWIRF